MMRAFTRCGALMLAVLIAGCDNPTVPPDGSDESALSVQTTAGMPVYEFTAEAALVPGASSKITRNDSGVTTTFHATGLERGHAYSLWLVVFNVPGACDAPCDEPDVVPGTDAEVDLMAVVGNIAGQSGKATFSGRRSVGDNSGSLFVQFGAPAPGLTDVYGAELHLVLRDHGPAIPGQIPHQIMSYEGGCTPGSSFGLGNGSYECEDIQFSVHMP